MDLVALKTEITGDPAAIGYATANGDHEAIAKLLNKPQRTIDAETINGGVLVSCLDKTEFAALTAADKAYLNLFITAGDVPVSANARQALRSLFPAGTETRNRINAATRRKGSRAEELELGPVTESDVADALRS